MSWIINIDTAIDSATISLAENGKLIHFRENIHQKDHAAWIHSAIKEMVAGAGLCMQDISAVALVNGPGSYTGLRIALATAKGLCYTLQIPLITVGSLEMLAVTALARLNKKIKLSETALLSPMIDARRMEVYTTVYDITMTELIKPHPMILNEDSINKLASEKIIYFFGNGSNKLRNIILHSNMLIVENISIDTYIMSGLTFEYYKQKRFADIAYAEPLYVKDFYFADKSV